MSELIERLRSGYTPSVNGQLGTWQGQCNEAADLIEAQSARIAELEKAGNALAKAAYNAWASADFSNGHAHDELYRACTIFEATALKGQTHD